MQALLLKDIPYAHKRILTKRQIQDKYNLYSKLDAVHIISELKLKNDHFPQLIQFHKYENQDKYRMIVSPVDYVYQTSSKIEDTPFEALVKELTGYVREIEYSSSFVLPPKTIEYIMDSKVKPYIYNFLVQPFYTHNDAAFINLLSSVWDIKDFDFTLNIILKKYFYESQSLFVDNCDNLLQPFMRCEIIKGA